MRFRLDGRDAYVLTKTKDGVMVNNPWGELMDAEQMLEVAEGMITYAKAHEKDILLHNMSLQNKPFVFFGGEEKKKVQPRQVYFLECGGKYKVGVTKELDRRIRELDCRPFKVTLLAHSRMMEEAFEVEQEIHEFLENKKIEGEWYNLNLDEVESIKKMVEEL